jgi:hypothetical protein
MTIEQLFRFAEDLGLRVTVSFDPGHDGDRPGRGYVVTLGDREATTPKRGRLDEAIQLAVAMAFEALADAQQKAET